MNGPDLAIWLAVYVPRVLRLGKAVAFTRAFPWWLRCLYILGIQAWCPLPIDEAFLALAVGVTLCVPRYRTILRAAWAGSALGVAAG